MKRDELAFALKLAQPCVMVAEYAPILVHFCFDQKQLFAYDAVSAITVDFATGLQCALRGETLSRLVELAGEEVELVPDKQDESVHFRSGRSVEVTLPYLPKSSFLWKGLKEEPTGVAFKFDDDLLRGWRLCANSIAKEAPQPAWTALNMRLGPQPLLAACDGVSSVRYQPKQSFGKKERTVLIPKSVVDQVLWIAGLLAPPKPEKDSKEKPKSLGIRAILGDDALVVDFDAVPHVQLFGKLLPEKPFDFEQAMKSCRVEKERQPIPEGFANAVARVGAVRMNEQEKVCGLSSDGKKLLVHGGGSLGEASTSFKFNGTASDLQCDPDRLTRYLGEVQSVTLSDRGVVFYGEQFAQFTPTRG